MRYKLSLMISIFIIIIFSGSLVTAADDFAVVQKLITTHKGDANNPYTTFYPIQLERPGLIHVQVRPVNPEMPLHHPRSPIAFKIYLVSPDIFVDMDNNNWLNWLNNPDEIYPEMRRIRRRIFIDNYVYESLDIKDSVRPMNYPVDSIEFNKSEGKYVIYLQSMVQNTVESIFAVRYPGSRHVFDPEVDKYRRVKPDLAVENISLDDNKNLQVQIKNTGQAIINSGYWILEREKAVTLIAEIQGRNYGATLAHFDPEEKLRNKNGTVTYTFDTVKINNKTKVKVTVDKNNILNEKNENNNQKETEIGGSGFEMGPPKISLNIGLESSSENSEPDLEVKSISLNQQNEIIIELENIGESSIDQNLWHESNLILKLKKDGSSWANIYKNGFDPENKLINPGGKVIFNTGFKLNQSAVIEAIIDQTDVIDEADEENNIKEVMLQLQ